MQSLPYKKGISCRRRPSGCDPGRRIALHREDNLICVLTVGSALPRLHDVPCCLIEGFSQLTKCGACQRMSCPMFLVYVSYAVANYSAPLGMELCHKVSCDFQVKAPGFPRARRPAPGGRRARRSLGLGPVACSCAGGPVASLPGPASQVTLP